MSYTALTVLGFSLIFLSTTLGSSLVFFFKREISEKLNTLFLGFAAGIMIAASVWSLLIPSIEAASDWGTWSFVPAATGFVAGGLFLVLLDKIVPHFHSGTNEDEGPQTSLNKPVKMCFLRSQFTIFPKDLQSVSHSERQARLARTLRMFRRSGLRSALRYRIFPRARRCPFR